MFGNKLHKVEHAIEKGKVSVLLNCTEDKDEKVKLAAIDGLGELKSDDGVNHLINLLHSPSVEVRKHAAMSLGKIGNVHSKEHIVNAVGRETDSETIEVMRKALTMLKEY